jgi:hypothetical protein
MARAAARGRPPVVTTMGEDTMVPAITNAEPAFSDATSPAR